MVKRDNPAGRLHEILTNARNHPNKRTFEMWALILGVDLDNKTEIVRAICQVQYLLDDVQDKISKIEGINKQLYLSRFPDLENAVKVTNFDIPWDAYRAHLNEATMLNLAHCAEVLARYDEASIEESELAELLKSVDELAEQIWKADLDDTLKHIIADLLETIRRSLREYRIRGAEGLRKELAYCIGTLMQNHVLFKAEEAKEEVGRFAKILSKLNALVSFALKLKELGFDYSTITGFIEKG